MQEPLQAYVVVTNPMILGVLIVPTVEKKKNKSQHHFFNVSILVQSLNGLPIPIFLQDTLFFSLSFLLFSNLFPDPPKHS